MKTSAFAFITVVSSASGTSGQVFYNDKPDACVSIYVHPDGRCNDKAIEVISFPTWTEPGSPCFTNDKMIFSVKDRYCNTETGNWHQTLYPKGGCGEVPWWLSWIFPQDQTFAPDSCILGFFDNKPAGLSLKSCISGPCGDDAINPESAFDAFSRNLRS